jgi:transcriptional regulator with XRE-family HTH domain
MNKTPAGFGAYLRHLRATAQIGLREFAELAAIDPGNVSKIERGLMGPPEDAGQLSKMARAVGVEPDTTEWQEFHDLAAIGRGKVPADIMSDEEVVKKLPMFFRGLRGEALDDNEMATLVEKIRRA